VASTDLSPGLRTRRQQVARVATIALVAVAYFAVIVVVLHFLRPDLNPIRRPTSEYAVGPYGFLMTSAFFSMSLGSFALVIGLYRGVSQRARSGIGLVLLGIWAVGVLIAMSFPIDPEGAPQTLSGTIHRINGPLAFLSLTAGTILVSRRFRQDGLWRPIHRSAVILSLVMLAAFIANFVNIATASGFAGLCQRIFLVAFVTWFVLTAERLRSISSRSVPSR
jgi:bacteriorhodopsin